MDERLKTILCVYHGVKVINRPSYSKSRTGRQTQWSDGRQFGGFIMVNTLLANTIRRRVMRVVYYSRYFYGGQLVDIDRARANEANKVFAGQHFFVE